MSVYTKHGNQSSHIISRQNCNPLRCRNYTFHKLWERVVSDYDETSQYGLYRIIFCTIVYRIHTEPCKQVPNPAWKETGLYKGDPVSCKWGPSEKIHQHYRTQQDSIQYADTSCKIVWCQINFLSS